MFSMDLIAKQLNSIQRIVRQVLAKFATPSPPLSAPVLPPFTPIVLASSSSSTPTFAPVSQASSLSSSLSPSPSSQHAKEQGILGTRVIRQGPRDGCCEKTSLATIYMTLLEVAKVALLEANRLWFLASNETCFKVMGVGWLHGNATKTRALHLFGTRLLLLASRATPFWFFVGICYELGWNLMKSRFDVLALGHSLLI